MQTVSDWVPDNKRGAKWVPAARIQAAFGQCWHEIQVDKRALLVDRRNIYENGYHPNFASGPSHGVVVSAVEIDGKIVVESSGYVVSKDSVKAIRKQINQPSAPPKLLHGLELPAGVNSVRDWILRDVFPEHWSEVEI
ncbi:MAG: hypothetical protein HQK59_01785 [Deltaproteobacteria bacterium]|nr:hypothetical protein [Deltaproteobacteria bacterium]